LEAQMLPPLTPGVLRLGGGEPFLQPRINCAVLGVAPPYGRHAASEVLAMITVHRFLRV
jgi:hypothetical protein